MIINKSSFERGFGNGVVYVTEVVDLSEVVKARGGAGKSYSSSSIRFCNYLPLSPTYVPGMVPKKKGGMKKKKEGDESADNVEANLKHCYQLDVDGFPLR